LTDRLPAHQDRTSRQWAVGRRPREVGLIGTEGERGSAQQPQLALFAPCRRKQPHRLPAAVLNRVYCRCRPRLVPRRSENRQTEDWPGDHDLPTNHVMRRVSEPCVRARTKVACTTKPATLLPSRHRRDSRVRLFSC
jgi:hypothetical protein